MKSIIKTSVIGWTVASALILSSCEQSLFVDAYDVRDKAAAGIGIKEGSPTVWNDDTTLELGRIYYVFGSRKHGYVLKSYSGLFVPRINDKTVSTTTPDNSSWSNTISDTDKINLQLGYMGLSGQFGVNAVKKITFSLDGDAKGEVMAMDSLETILNDPDNGPNLRASIMQDTLNVVNNRLDKSLAKFWIVLEVHTAKNLAVTLNTDTGVTAKLDTSDAATLASWIKVPNLTFPTIDVEPDHTTDVSFKDPDSFGWVAMCVPLFAYLDGPQKGQIYPDESTILWAANTLHD
jgi:hypothetical protein